MNFKRWVKIAAKKMIATKMREAYSEPCLLQEEVVHCRRCLIQADILGAL